MNQPDDESNPTHEPVRNYWDKNKTKIVPPSSGGSREPMGEGLSLQETVIKKLKNGEVNTPAFQSIVRAFGKERIVKICNAYKKDGEKIFTAEYWEEKNVV